MARASVSQGRRLRRPTVSVRDINDNNREKVVRTQQKRNEILRPNVQQPQQTQQQQPSTDQQANSSSSDTSVKT